MVNHEASVWAVCPTCGGGEVGEYGAVCYHCVHGVVAMVTAADAAILNAAFLPPTGAVVAGLRAGVGAVA